MPSDITARNRVEQFPLTHLTVRVIVPRMSFALFLKPFFTSKRDAAFASEILFNREREKFLEKDPTCPVLLQNHLTPPVY